MINEDTWARIKDLRTRLHSYKPKKLDPDLQRDLKHGWLLPYLLHIDDYTWGRWDYWVRTVEAGILPDDPIPRITFECGGTQAEGLDSRTGKHLQKCLDLIPEYGSWQGWESWKYFDYLMDWLLYGFGYAGQPDLPKEPSPSASMRLYQTLDLHWLMLYPYDYWGGILADNAHGRHLGFYPTPHTVVEMMCRMSLEGGDRRLETVCDPCLGTGRMLLHASNYSLRLYGMDINPTVIKASLVNGYLYAPWLVKPIPFLDAQQYQPDMSEAISDHLASADVQPEVAAYLAETEFDHEQAWRFEPIKKRRRKGQPEDSVQIAQGLLF